MRKGISRALSFTSSHHLISIRPIYIFSIIVLTCFWVYSPSIYGPFIFDDEPNIALNPNIRMESFSLSGLLKAGFGNPNGSRPVSKATFTLNYFIHDYDVFGYHLVNVIIHLTCGILLLFFIRKTLYVVRQKNIPEGYLSTDPLISDQEFWVVAGLTSLIWMLHPIQTQSVSYIVQRMNSMAAMFYLFSFNFYIRARLTDNPKKLVFFWIGCAVSGTLAMGSKQNAATLPVFLFLYEWFFFQDLNICWIKRKFIWIVACIGVFFVAGLLYTKGDPLSVILGSYSGREFTLTQRVLTQPRVVLFYLSLLFFPHLSRLNLDHEFNISAGLFSPVSTFFTIILLAGLIALTIFATKKYRLAAFCVFWYFGNIAMESSFLGLEMVFEHRNYLPSMMIIFAVVLLLKQFTKKNMLLFVGCSFFLIATLGYASWNRNHLWGNELLLWQNVVEKSPNKARPHNNLGMAYANAGQLDPAFRFLQKSINIDQSYAPAHYNMGLLLMEIGDNAAAIGYFHNSIRHRPLYWQAYHRMGLAHLRLGNKDLAMQNFKKSIQIKPEMIDAHFEIAQLISEDGWNNEAIEYLETILKSANPSADGHMQLAHMYLESGNLRQALIHYANAFRLDPSSSDASNNLGAILASLGRTDEASKLFKEAKRLDPSNFEAQKNLEKLETDLN